MVFREHVDLGRRFALKGFLAGGAVAVTGVTGLTNVFAESVEDTLPLPTQEEIDRAKAAGVSDDKIQASIDKNVPLEAMEKAYKAGVLSENDTPEEYNFYFFFISVLSGLGIAIDVFVATLAMYRKLNTPKKKALWAALVGGSHIALPVATGSMAWGSQKGFGQEDRTDLVSKGISVVGFAAITKFLWDELTDDDDDDENEGEEDGDILNAKNWKALALAVWGVSADAAFSGPAKADQTMIEGWSIKKTLISAGIGGVTVAAVALAGIAIADYLRNSSNENVESFLEENEDLAMNLETLVLNYFGTNGLLNGALGLNLSFLTTSIINAVTSGALIKVARSQEA